MKTCTLSSYVEVGVAEAWVLLVLLDASLTFHTHNKE